MKQILHETLGQRLHVTVTRVNSLARVGAWPRVQRRRPSLSSPSSPPPSPPLLLRQRRAKGEGGAEEPSFNRQCSAAGLRQGTPAESPRKEDDISGSSR